MSSFAAYNIIKLVDTVGEEEVRDILSDFSCEKNLEIEVFVRDKALDFAKKRMSVTYLVLDEESELAAIFTLAHSFRIFDERYSLVDNTKYIQLFKFM